MSSSHLASLAREMEDIAIDQIAAIAPETASAVGSSLPLEKHGVDAPWRALAEKHLR